MAPPAFQDVLQLLLTQDDRQHSVPNQGDENHSGTRKQPCTHQDDQGHYQEGFQELNQVFQSEHSSTSKRS